MRLFSASFIFLSLVGLFQDIEAAKILAIFPFPGPSQYIVVQPYLKALAARGHEVTLISAFERKEPIKNIRDIAVTAVHKAYDEIISDAMVDRNKWQELNFFEGFFRAITLNVLEDEQVQRFLHSNEKFDLVILETLLNDALCGFSQHYNVPLIGFSSFGTDPSIDETVGNISPIAYSPLVTAGFTYRMSFWERVTNLYLITLETLHVHTVSLPGQIKMYKKYFPNAKVDLLELRKNYSLMLVNQHFSLSYPRPYVPNMIEVGGFHINQKSSPLPTDMEEFINGSEHGVIYFSMGSNVKSKDLPPETLDVLMRTFGSLRERVMWKFENPELPGKPKNVYINKWFPQSDILAHPKVKLFITHGGLLSTIEAIYHGKPIIGIPVFYDQFLNVENAVKMGFGMKVDLKNLIESDLKSTINKILTNPSFTEVARKMSKRYRDQPMSPLDTAIYWTEYVLRHEGAAHMRNAAQDMSFIEKHSLDTIGMLLGGLVSVLLVFIWLVWKTISVIFGKRSNKHKKEKKK